MDLFWRIAEKKIREAMDRGDFDDLPGKGEPLVLEDDSRVPEDLRLAYKILKNADYLPPEVADRQEIRQMEDLLAGIEDEREKYKQMKRLNYRIMRLNSSRRTRVEFEIPQHYLEKVVDRLGKKA